MENTRVHRHHSGGVDQGQEIRNKPKETIKNFVINGKKGRKKIKASENGEKI